MEKHRAAAVGWYHAAAAAGLPWVGLYRPEWLPAAIILVVLVHRYAMRVRDGEPWRALAIAASSLVVLVISGGWGVAGCWMVAAAALASGILVMPMLKSAARPDVADLAAGAVWATALVLRPEIAGPKSGGWVASLLLILACRRAVAHLIVGRTAFDNRDLGPPSRDVRGTLSFGGVVADEHGLPRSLPLEFEVRAGTSLAILSDDAAVDDLAIALMGRRPILDGQLCIDGVPPGVNDRVMAIIAAGEAFLPGGLDDNVGAFQENPLEPGVRAAIVEACSLGEIKEALGERPIRFDGRPLEQLHRFLLQTARVLASHYRVLLVVDPLPWVNPVRAELWRNAVVRASVGRSALWITADRRLAERADEVLEFRHGTLRPHAASKGD